jgi:myo-inositol-1(or 4)-monophosphatase
MDLDARRRDAEAAAAAAGSVIRARRPGAVRAKAPGDWVSDVDEAAERAARAVLAERTPDLAFWGEEGGGTRGEIGWLLDPVDGTTNLLHGFPVVGVSVALVAGDRPLVGVVHAPLLGLTYSAAAGSGTTCNGRPVRVSDRPVGQAVCATGFPFRAKAARAGRYLEVFARVFAGVEDLRRAGAASLDLAWCADGTFDGFFELGLGPWDVAAGALCVREAGGVVTDWAGDPDGWLTSGDIIAGPPAVHEALLSWCIPSAGAPAP